MMMMSVNSENFKNEDGSTNWPAFEQAVYEASIGRLLSESSSGVVWEIIPQRCAYHAEPAAPYISTKDPARWLWIECPVCGDCIDFDAKAIRK